MSLLIRDYIVIDQLDFRNNHSDLVTSYVLRVLGLVVFGSIFYETYIILNRYATFYELINIELENVSSVVSIFLLVLDVVLVLYLHELIHALVYYLTNKQKPKINIRGSVIFAAAPNQIISKRDLIINAFSPFVVISIIGISLLSITPLGLASWVFMPTLVNAAASGGDFMVVYFVLKQKSGTQYNDKGDILYAIEHNVKQ